MRICRIVDRFPSSKRIKGDLAPNYYYFSKLTVEKGFEVHVICSRSEGEKKFEEIDGIKVHRVCQIRKYMDIFGSFAKKVYEKVKEIKPDIVHGHQNFHFGCLIGKHKLNSKIITHYHGILDAYKYADFLPFSYNFKRALYDRMIARYYFYETKFILKRSDHIIAVSNASKKHIEKYLRKPISVVYNGVDPSIFKPIKSDIKEQLNADYLILYVGRAVPWKGIQYLLRAANEFKDSNFKVLLLGVIRGDYPDIYVKWLKDLAKRLNLKNVIFSKQVPYSEMPRYYSAADCLVLPSYPEAFAKVVCEALACGTPVVATNGGGIPELLAGTKSESLLFKHRDFKELAEKIRIVFENPFRDLKVFSWDESVKKIVEVYECLW